MWQQSSVQFAEPLDQVISLYLALESSYTGMLDHVISLYLVPRVILHWDAGSRHLSLPGPYSHLTLGCRTTSSLFTSSLGSLTLGSWTMSLLFTWSVQSLHWDAAIVIHFETRYNPKPHPEVLPDIVQPLGDFLKTPSKVEL